MGENDEVKEAADEGKSPAGDSPADNDTHLATSMASDAMRESPESDMEVDRGNPVVLDVAEESIPMPHVAPSASAAVIARKDPEIEEDEEQGDQSVLTAPSEHLQDVLPGVVLNAKSLNMKERDLRVVGNGLAMNNGHQGGVHGNHNSVFQASQAPGREGAQLSFPLLSDIPSNHDTEFEPDDLQVETLVEKSFTAAKRAFGIAIDPSEFSGRVQIFGVDEVIQKMKVTSMERNFLLTRWMKARNSQKSKAKTNANYFRLIGLTKVLCGVLVPVIISTLSTVSRAGTWHKVLSNLSIVLSVLGTFATALEDFFQFGVRAANRTTCLSKLDRVFWEYQGLSGQFGEFVSQSGDAFRVFASSCEQHVFMVEDLHLSAMFSSEEKDKKEKENKDTGTLSASKPSAMGK